MALDWLFWQLAQVILECLGLSAAEELLSGSGQLVLEADETHGLLEGPLRRFRQDVASIDVSAEVVQSTHRVFEGLLGFRILWRVLKKSDEALGCSMAGEAALLD